MVRRSGMRFASAAHLAVTVLGVVGFVGFLVTARMDDAGASPFDYMAYGWFFVFGAIKFCLPWMLDKRHTSERANERELRSAHRSG